MCGISGIFSPSSIINKSSRMMEVLRHRGPDDECVFNNQNVFFAFCRLSIIDLKSGNQPMHNEDKSMYSMINGEIYNYEEIKTELIKKGHKFYTKSDCEVVLHLYEDIGTRAFERLNGIFSIAIYDKKKNSLVLVRDRFGVKPLYYSINDDNIYFASEIKSILENRELHNTMSMDALYHYMTFRYVPTPLTIYENIQSLEPAHFLLFNNKGIKKTSYWKMNFNESNVANECDISDELIFRLEQSVKLQSMSEVPVGSFLSGGIDSSLITALLDKHIPNQLHTFNLSYDVDYIDKREDENNAKLISDKLGTIHHIRYLSISEYIKSFDKIIRSFDQPFSHAFSTFFVSEMMQDNKIKVAFAGDGSDEIFGNYLAHRLAQPIFNHGNVGIHKDSYTQQELSLIGKMSKLKEHQWRNELYNMFSSLEKQKLFNSDIYTEMKGLNSEEYIKSKFASIETQDPQNRIQEYEMKTLLVDQILEFNDKLSMANSVECRVPYLENDFFDFASSLPGHHRINNTITKYILKKSASKILPRSTINRKNVGFQLPTNLWMKNELKEDIHNTLSKEAINQHNLFNYNYIDQLLTDIYVKNIDHVKYKVWSLYCFQKWYTNCYKNIA